MGELVAPRHEDVARAPIGQRGKREVGKFCLDAADAADIAVARALGKPSEIFARLIGLQHGEQGTIGGTTLRATASL
jgi:hypothetical protein